MTNKKLHVAFDMDDTLCSLVSPSMEVARRVLGRNLTLPTYGNYGGWFPGQLNDEEREELLRHVYQPDFYLNLPSNFSAMHNMSVERVSRVAHDHYDDVKVITARAKVLNGMAEEVTREWLKRHKFVGWADVPIHVHDHETRKSSFCNDESTVMVDDNHKVADDFASCPNHKVILIDQTWNAGHPRNSSIKRVASRRLCEALIQQAADFHAEDEEDQLRW